MPVLVLGGFSDIASLLRRPAIANFIGTGPERTANQVAAFHQEVVAVDNAAAAHAVALPSRVLPALGGGLAEEFADLCLHFQSEQATWVKERGIAIASFLARAQSPAAPDPQQAPTVPKPVNLLGPKSKFSNETCGQLLKWFQLANLRNLPASEAPHTSIVKQAFKLTHRLRPSVMRTRVIEQRYEASTVPILELTRHSEYRAADPPLFLLQAEFECNIMASFVAYSFPVGYQDPADASHPHFLLTPRVNIEAVRTASGERLALCSSASVAQTLVNHVKSALVGVQPPSVSLFQARADGIFDAICEELSNNITLTAAMTNVLKRADLFNFGRVQSSQPRTDYYVKTSRACSESDGSDSDSDRSVASIKSFRPRRVEHDKKRPAKRSDSAGRAKSKPFEIKPCFDWLEFGKCPVRDCRFEHAVENRGIGKAAKDALLKKSRRVTFSDGATSDGGRSADGDRRRRRI